MSIQRRDGFQIFNPGANPEYLAIESDRIADYMNYYREQNFERIYISTFHGYALNDLAFLSEYPFVKGLYVYSNDISLNGIAALKFLDFLILAGGFVGHIDFSHFVDLEVAHFSWKHSIENFAALRKIKELHIRDYGHDSLSAVPEFEQLKYLELIQCGIRSLSGVDRYRALEKLELHYLKKMTSLHGVEGLAASLKWLSVNQCKKINDHKTVSALQNLRELAFNECSDIPSLEFINSMPNLLEFVFWNTVIKDGDLTPCKRLQRVRFKPKKHYNLKPDQLPAS